MGASSNAWDATAKMKLTAVFMRVSEGYAAWIEELPGADTQGATLNEARENLHEAVAMVLDADRTMSEASLEGAIVIRESFALHTALVRLPFAKKTGVPRHQPLGLNAATSIKSLIEPSMSSTFIPYSCAIR